MNRNNRYLLDKKKDYRQRVDELELTLTKNFPLENCEWKHEFTPGMYIRTILMKKGQMISSRIHLTEHPFVITKGAVSVKQNDGTWVLLEAGYQGITKPGTHRILYVHVDTNWTTYHANPTDSRDVQEIEDRILDKYENPLLNNLKNEQWLTQQ